MLGDQPPEERKSHKEWLSYADYTCMKQKGVIESPDVDNAQKVIFPSTFKKGPILSVRELSKYQKPKCVNPKTSILLLKPCIYICN